MFDLPVKYSKTRNSLRFKLKQLGFIQFQKSVWIYPYPCLDEILFIVDYHKIGKYVEILEVSHLLREEKFIKSFKL
jgi:DNA-binding transcriptional regulator PaaX